MSAIYFRIPAYIFTIVLHITNSLYMISCFQGDAMKNDYVRQYQQMQLYFFTCWTFTFQTIHAVVALYCDVLTLKHSNCPDFKLPKILVKFRDAFFTVVVWPSTILVSSVFWSFFHFDRSLIYPVDIDLAIPPVSNHIMHTSIAVLSVWEVVFKPRSLPKVHKWRLLATWMLEVVYVSTVIMVYLIKGKWVYPIFGVLLGSVHFYLFFVWIAAAIYLIYHAQWILSRLVWGTTVSEKVD
ncbi:androgen-dependent TFPI-regulating protein-like [Anticarsia gemmatalis]|uniref:androgen-dependent TFPI-regulating protein-like n=1 Tax=Anticarsia gemmatalis TaxID=129554 RepID=UPI003F75AFBF